LLGASDVLFRAVTVLQQNMDCIQRTACTAFVILVLEYFGLSCPADPLNNSTIPDFDSLLDLNRKVS
jgi:hypothetical protein